MLVTGASLAAVVGSASLGDDRWFSAWMFNHVLSGPTLRARRGERARIRLYNGLPEQTIVHWHGLVVLDGAGIHDNEVGFERRNP